MAFDGITVAAIVHEFNTFLKDGRIYKIAQPEKDELLLTVKNGGNQYRVLLSANASLPLAYLTNDNKVSPAVAPTFTMLLRKHLQNGRIISISQPDFERIIMFEIEHLDEMGDICRKRLIVELMGKYSNIIFTDSDNKILDSIKHINAMVSSVREVLPGGTYEYPPKDGKINPLTTDYDEFARVLRDKNCEIGKALYMSYTGISPYMAYRMVEATENMSDKWESIGAGEALSDEMLNRLWGCFTDLFNRVGEGNFAPQLIYENGEVTEYIMADATSAAKTTPAATDGDDYKPVSDLIVSFYKEKETKTRSKQKSADLRKIVQTILERDVKKYDLQLKQLKDTDKMEKYKVYGELLHTYGYSVEDGAKQITVNNYYTNEPVTIPLDDTISAMDNAKRYFDKYGKLKRTKEALLKLTVEVKEQIDHLESILQALDIAEREEDINEIKEEMIESGYIRRKSTKGVKQRFKSKPYHFVGKDGFHMYVGKNNYQNDELTFKMANGGDWWFHAKGLPGSHVILKCDGKEPTDRTFEEAARLAAHFSKGNGSDRVEIDYLKRKDVKKPNGSKPGFVVYYTNYSMVIDNNIEGLEQVEE